MLRERFWIVGKLPRGLAMDRHHFHIERFQEFGHSDATRRIHRIHGDLELGGANAGSVDQRQPKHMFHVVVQPPVFHGRLTSVVHLSKDQVLFCKCQHPVPILAREKFSLFIQQLQRIPLFGVVGSRQNQPPLRLQRWHCNLHSGRGAEAQIHHIHAKGVQGPTDHIADPRTRDACIASNDDFGPPHFVGRPPLPNPSAVPSCELCDVNGAQAVSPCSTHGAADA